MFTNILNPSKYEMINTVGSLLSLEWISVLGKCKDVCVCCGKAVQIKASCVSPRASLELETGSWAQPSEPAGRRATRLVWDPPLEKHRSGLCLKWHSFICYEPLVRWRNMSRLNFFNMVKGNKATVGCGSRFDEKKFKWRIYFFQTGTDWLVLLHKQS